MHFLPCGAHRGREPYELARTRQFHAAGPGAPLVLQPAPVHRLPARVRRGGCGRRAPARARRPSDHVPGLRRRRGRGRVHDRAAGPVRLHRPRPRPRSTARLVREAVDQGKDGFMEDFGECTSPVTRSADGTPPARIHNRYPRDYHCARSADRRAATARPVVRFQRSGWTGAARCSVNVWGGDPTTVWGFDGLRSAVTQALTIGMSGVARWGSDIGGYNSFGAGERLSRELLDRWIQLGAVSGVMRTKRSGIALPAYERPQVFDPASMPIWRRYAKLHTQLLPYIEAADAEYRATGMPLMRHGLLTDPGDARAIRADDQFGFGTDLLAAPVLRAGRAPALALPAARALGGPLALRALRRARRQPEPRQRAPAARPPAGHAARPARRAAAARARRRRAAAPARRRGHARAVRRRGGGATRRPARPHAAARLPARALRVAAWARAASGSCRSRATGAGRSPCAGSAPAAIGSRRRSGRSRARSPRGGAARGPPAGAQRVELRPQQRRPARGLPLPLRRG